MIVLFAVYKTDTGEIVRSGSCPEDVVELQAEAGEATLLLDEAVSDADFYVVDGVVTPRPEIPFWLEDDLLRGVPEGTQLRIDNEFYTADGEDIELEFASSGTYILEMELFPYKPERVEYRL